MAEAIEETAIEGTEYRKGGQRAIAGTKGFRGGQMAVEETEGRSEDRGP